MKILTKNCVICGKEYIKRQNCSKTEWKLSKYCCYSCSYKGKIGKIAPNRKYYNTPCKTCGKVFKPRVANNIYCSKECSETVFQKGHTPWHSGTRGMGIKEGVKHSTETKEKLSEMFKGENSHFWKGGVSNENHRIRQTSEYREWRTKVFKRDDYTCQKCGKKGGKIQADHIKQFAFYTKLRFKLSNGRTLCIPCHKQTDTYAKNLK